MSCTPVKDIPPQWPALNSIPPSTFYLQYGMNGLASFLNQNPEYKQFFVAQKRYLSPALYSQSTIQEVINMGLVPSSYSSFSTQNVPMDFIVTTLNQHEARLYQTQFNTFLKVYGHNSNAYINYISCGVTPTYYRFASSSDLMTYKAGLQLANKLYIFDGMKNGKNYLGSTLNWNIPFPL
jgi:hypothetical protein